MLLTPVGVPSALKDFIEPQNRPALERATRDELLKYAKTKGLDLDCNMPRDLIIVILRERGYTDIKAAVRVMGKEIAFVGDDGIASGPTQIKSVDATADLRAQYERNKHTPVNPIPRVEKPMSMNELRSEAKRRGIKLERTDTARTIREKLNGEQATS